MAGFDFVIPSTNEELLNETDNHYYVRNQIKVKDVRAKLKDAKRSLEDKGPEFIIQTFDTFYSIIQLSEILQVDLIVAAEEMLLQSVQDLKGVIVVALENIRSLDHESKLKHRNIIKMLLYVYVNINMAMEEKIKNRPTPKVSSTARTKRMIRSFDDTVDSINRKMVVLSIETVFQEKINVFWDPPVVDEALVSTAIKICFHYLACPFILNEQELQLNIFHFIAILIKDYNQGATFSYEVVQLIKMQTHFVDVFPGCVRNLIETYNCKSFVSQFVEELIKSQAEERLLPSEGVLHCLVALSDITQLIPSSIMHEIVSFQRYLDDESFELRNAYLKVTAHIVINFLTGENVTKKQKHFRDTFLFFLERGIDDASQQVRSNVLRLWLDLQCKNAIPSNQLNKFFKKAIASLRDEFTDVRLWAAECVNEFMALNIYGSNLQLDSLKNELEQKMALLDSMKLQFESKNEELRTKWKKHEEALRTVIEQKLKQKLKPPFFLTSVDENNLPAIIRSFILEKKYEEAFLTLKYCSSIKQLDEWNKRSESGELELFVLLRTLYMNEKVTNTKESPEINLSEFTILQDAVSSLQKVVEVLQLINDAIEPMKELIESPNFDITRAAIKFFALRFHYNMDNVSAGFSVMLKFMHSNDPQRRDAVFDAFKMTYLMTTFLSVNKHRSLVVKNLIDLTKYLFNQVDDVNADLELAISASVADGLLDDDIIDLLWNSFTKQCDVSDSDSYYTIALLSMVARRKQAIVTNKIKLAATIGFGEKAKHNLLLATGVCEFLLLADPKKDQLEDTHWADLINTLTHNFYGSDLFYQTAITYAVKLIYKLCTKPDALCIELMEQVWVTLPKIDCIERFLIVQCDNILAQVVSHHFQYLKQFYLCKYRKKAKKQNKGNRNVEKVSSVSQKFTKKSNTGVSDTDNATIEGAQDVEVEFLSNILEKCTILSRCSDLSVSNSKMIQTSGRLCAELQNFVFEVRHSSAFLISQLILKDMMHSDDCILRMAIALVDEEEQMRTMSKEFFGELFRKDQNVCNLLSDIVRYLLELSNFKEDDIRIIIKFLVSLIDKTKQNEYLVDCMCLRFRPDEDQRNCRNIAYCLSLVTYNEIGLEKLLDNFESYRNQPGVLVIIKKIVRKFIENNGISKEIEDINTFFLLNSY